MSVIIRVDGQKESVEPENGKTFSLKELQKAVGGYIEIVPVISGQYLGMLMIVDEEGLLKPNPVLNIEASNIAGQQIVGDVIIIDKNQIE